jgi:hypothetical protein
MTTHQDMIYALGGVPVELGIGTVGLAGGNWYFFDPTHGATGADALTPQTATKSLKTAYDLCRDGYNDGVVFIGGATAWNPTAALTWSKSYTHLIGTNSIPGVGNRCRIVAQATADLTVPLIISGSGCLFKNFQVYNEHATGAATGAVSITTGARNIFEDVFFMSPVSSTAASYSCKLASAENVFVRCTFGQFTNARSAASYSLWITGTGNVSRNKFIKCEFLSWGANAAHFLVNHDSTLDAVPTVTWFEECLFNNIGTSLTAAISDGSTAAGHQIVFRGQTDFLNVTAVGDVLTYMFCHDQATTPSGLLMTVVAES